MELSKQFKEIWEKRDAQIVKLRASGKSVAAIATRYGISQARVYQILATERNRPDVLSALVPTASDQGGE